MNISRKQIFDTLVVGGGAAGFFSAIHHQLNHPEDRVAIIEKSGDFLSKVKISGGGRCNVTHACFDPKLLSEHYPRGGKELLGPFHHFQPRDTIRWFESRGVRLKIESDNRVFPVSDDSQTIIDCLIDTATLLGVILIPHCPVSQITKLETHFTLLLADQSTFTCQKLVLATGSGRQGYGFAQGFGHTIEDPIPSLFTLAIKDKELRLLSGLSVNSTEVWIEGEQKRRQKGPLLITHWGVSGPSIIKLSAWNAPQLFERDYCTALYINWMAGLDEEEVKAVLLKFQHTHPKKTVIKHSPFAKIPSRLWEYLAQRSGLTLSQCWHHLNSKHLDRLRVELRQSVFNVTGKGIFKEEFVTCGGVSLKEVNFKTMESKFCSGLFIVGELLNVDGVTGGFNFQNAWTTGFLSGS